MPLINYYDLEGNVIVADVDNNGKFSVLRPFDTYNIIPTCDIFVSDMDNNILRLMRIPNDMYIAVMIKPSTGIPISCIRRQKGTLTKNSDIQHFYVLYVDGCLHHIATKGSKIMTDIIASQDVAQFSVCGDQEWINDYVFSKHGLYVLTTDNVLMYCYQTVDDSNIKYCKIKLSQQKRIKHISNLVGLPLIVDGDSSLALHSDGNDYKRVTTIILPDDCSTHRGWRNIFTNFDSNIKSIYSYIETLLILLENGDVWSMKIGQPLMKLELSTKISGIIVGSHILMITMKNEIYVCHPTTTEICLLLERSPQPKRLPLCAGININNRDRFAKTKPALTPR